MVDARQSETGIPAAIQVLTGITNDMVAGGRASPRSPRSSSSGSAAGVRRAQRALRLRLPAPRIRAHRPQVPGEDACSVRLSRRLYPEHRRTTSTPDRAPRHRLPRAPPRARRRGRGVAVPAHRRAGARTGNPRGRRAPGRNAPRCRRTSSARRSTRSPKRPGSTSSMARARRALHRKSVNLRQRVLSHFSAPALGEEMHLAREVRRIECSAPGELGALLREARLVKELAPPYNRHLKRPTACAGSSSTARGCGSRRPTRSTPRPCPGARSLRSPAPPCRRFAISRRGALLCCRPWE